MDKKTLIIEVKKQGTAQAVAGLRDVSNQAKITEAQTGKMATGFEKLGASSAKGFGKVTASLGGLKTGLIKSTGSALDSLGNGFTKVCNFLSGRGSSAISGYIGKLSGVIEKFGGLKSIMIAVIAIQIAKWFLNCALSASRFLGELANIGTLIPDQTAKLRAYGTEISKISRDYGKSQSDIASATYQVISAFGDQSNALQITKISAMAAKAGLAETADAVNLLSAVSKGYNDTSTETIQKISDLAFNTVKLGQTTFPELAASMGQVVPIASSLGVSMEELFAVNATLTGVTGTTSEVNTQLRSVLVALLQPTSELSKLYKEIGVKNGKEFIAVSGGIGNALVTIQSESKKSGVEFSDYFGRVEALTAGLALTGSQMDVFREKSASMNNVTGMSKTAFDTVTNGVNRYGENIKKMSSSWEVFVNSIGSIFLPLISMVAIKIALVLDTISPIFNFLGSIVALAETLARPIDLAMNASLIFVKFLSEQVFNRLSGLIYMLSDFLNSVFTKIGDVTMKGCQIIIDASIGLLKSLKMYNKNAVDDTKKTFELLDYYKNQSLSKKQAITPYSELIKSYNEQNALIKRNSETILASGKNYDTTAERVANFKSTLDRMTSTAGISSKQIDAFIRINKDLFDIMNTDNSIKEKTTEIKEMTKSIDLMDTSAGRAFTAMQEKALNLGEAIGGIKKGLTDAVPQLAIDGFKQLGSAFADGSMSGDEFLSALGDIAKKILDMLPMLFIQAGLTAIAGGNIGIGIGLITAGLGSAFVSGFVESMGSSGGGSSATATGDRGAVPADVYNTNGTGMSSNVMVNVQNYTGAPVQTVAERTANGGTVLKMIVGSAVKSLTSEGEFNSVNKSTYGMAPVGVRQ